MLGFCGDRVLVAGNFNVNRFSGEKLGGRGSKVTSSMSDFNTFICDCALCDPPISNSQFTWFAPNTYSVASCIDRFLYSLWLEELFPNLIQDVLSCVVLWFLSFMRSIESPLVLGSRTRDFLIMVSPNSLVIGRVIVLRKGGPVLPL